MRKFADARVDLLDGLSARLRAELLARAANLIARIQDASRRPQILRALALRMSEAAETRVGARDELRGAIDDWPLAAMLAARPYSSHPAPARVDLLQAWVLAAALLFALHTGLDDRDHVIQRAARVARRLTTDRDLAWLAIRLDEPLRDLDEAIEAYDRLRAELEKESGATAKHDARMAEVCGLLSRCEDPRLRESSGGPRGGRPATIEIRPGVDRTVRENALAALGVRIAPCLVVLDREVQTEEEAADYVDAEPIFELGPSAPGCGLADLMAESRRRVAEVVVAPAVALTDSACLTAAEARAILGRAKRDLRRNPGDAGAALAAASIVFGRPVEALTEAMIRKTAVKGHAFWIDLDGAPALAQAPDVTDSEQTLTARTPGVYAMRIPAMLAEPIRRLRASPPASPAAVQAARDWLRRSGVGARQPRLERLGRFLEDVLEMEDEDSAVVALLAGRRSRERPQLFYATTAIASLERAWRGYREAHLGLPRETAPLVVSPVGASTVGTRQAPSADAVRAHFARLRERVEASRFRAPAEEAVVGLHGAFVDYVGAMLAFLAGARPHGPAYPSLGERLGRARPALRLSDKENRSVGAARWIPLPAAAAAQIAALEAHMTAIEGWFRLSMPEAAAMAKMSWSGTGPSLFVIDSVLRRPAALSAADLHERTGAPEAMPRNWARHFLRGQLIADGVPGRCVDAFMGHGGALADPYRKTSAASMAALDAVRAALDDLCAELGLHPLQGLSR